MEQNFSLEPMTLGQLLDRAFRVFRSNFWTLIGIAALVQIFSLILQLLIQFFTLSVSTGDPFATFSDNPALLLGTIGGGVIIFVLTIILSLLTSAALSRAVGNVYLGEKLGVVESFRAVTPRLGRVLIYTVVAGLIGAGLAIWTLVPCVGWLTGPGMLLSISIVGTIGIPILILEDQGAWDSLVRAWLLVRRRFWWVVGFFLIVTLLTTIITTGPTLLITAIGSASLPAFPSVAQQMTVNSIQLVVTTLLNTLIIPFTTVAYIMMYFDLRIRTEGFDLAVDAADGDLGMTPAKLLSLQVPRNLKLEVTGDDWRNFFLASLIALVLYGVLVGIVFAISGVAAGF